MSTGLENIRERMAGYLTERGVRAVTAWPQGQRQVLEAPVAVVSLRACEAGPAGFQNYLHGITGYRNLFVIPDASAAHYHIVHGFSFRVGSLAAGGTHKRGHS